MVHVIAFHKSGSMFLYGYFKKISEIKKYKYYSCNNKINNSYAYKTNNDFKNILCPHRYPPVNFNPIDTYIINIRDPIDILISSFYSFGYTHKAQDDKYFKERREFIRNNTIDTYCLDSVETNQTINKYRNIIKFIEDNKHIGNIHVVYYTDMINNFSEWNKNICDILNIKDLEDNLLYTFKQNMEIKNIKNNEDILSGKIKKAHRRNGKDNQCKKELKKNTIIALYNRFDFIYKYFKKLTNLNQLNDNMCINNNKLFIYL